MNEKLVLELLLALLDRAVAYGALLAKARAEGRDVTDAEVDGLEADDDAKREEGRLTREAMRP